MNEPSSTQPRVSRNDQQPEGKTGRGEPGIARLWLRWTLVFEKAAKKGRESLRMPDVAYRELYKDLLNSLGRLEKAEGLTNAERDVYRRMGRLCSPWMSLEPLPTADRRIAHDVGRNARSLYRELVGDRLAYARLAAFTLTLGILAMFGVLTTWLLRMNRDSDSGGIASWLADGARGAWYLACYTIEQQHFTGWVLVGVAAILAIGIWTLRSVKTF